MTTPPIRVLLVDDQPLLRTGFRMILSAESDITVVGEATEGASAIEQARRLNPDVVLMDIRMPGRTRQTQFASGRREDRLKSARSAVAATKSLIDTFI